MQSGALVVVTLSIEIPDATLRALGLSPSEAEGRVRLAAAMKLHELGQLSSGAEAGLAGITRVEFLYRLGEFGVNAFQESPEELAHELAELRSTRA